MKLQRQKTREVKDKEYFRWVVVLPHTQLEKLGWEEGDQLEAEVLGNGLMVRKKAQGSTHP